MRVVIYSHEFFSAGRVVVIEVHAIIAVDIFNRIHVGDVECIEPVIFQVCIVFKLVGGIFFELLCAIPSISFSSSVLSDV